MYLNSSPTLLRRAFSLTVPFIGHDGDIPGAIIGHRTWAEVKRGPLLKAVVHHWSAALTCSTAEQVDQLVCSVGASRFVAEVSLYERPGDRRWCRFERHREDA